MSLALFSFSGSHMMSTNTLTDSDAQIPKLPCEMLGERPCEDGSCIPRVDLCPEEQLMNQNTILIMIVVGLAVVIFLIILYCFQQKQRRSSNRQNRTSLEGRLGLTDNESDNLSLYMPPPSYDEVVSTNLYPPTPRLHLRQSHCIQEEPITPPPNYDAALQFLAQSCESVFSMPKRASVSTLVRRSLSCDQISNVGSAENDSDGQKVTNGQCIVSSCSRQNSFTSARQPASLSRQNSSQSGRRVISSGFSRQNSNIQNTSILEG